MLHDEHDPYVAVCPICERAYDGRAYQLVIRELGAFDTVACAEEALRRHRRRTNGELATDLLDAVQREGAARDAAGEPERGLSS